MICVSESEFAIILNILQKHAADCEIRAFGSRYAWTSRDSSDLDLALVGSAKLGVSRLGILREAFEESSLPFRVDVLDWYTMTKEFQSIISKGYEVIYSPKKNKKEKWQKVRLGDVCEIKGGKRLPKGKNLIPTQNSHPYIRIKDLTNIRLLGLTPEFEYVDDETQLVISKYIVKTGDVIISIVGTIGLVSIIDNSLNNANLTENCAKFIDMQGLDNLYLYYFLKSPVGQEEIHIKTVGAVQPKLPLKNIQDLLIPLPPLPTQRAIAATLSCLDEKIELNRRINANLEAQAQAIFKSWFVDFEPFKDGDFVDGELGSIPKGWRVGSFTSIVDVLGGGTPKTDNHAFWNGHIPFFTPKDIDGSFVIATEKYITDEGLTNCSSKLYPINTIFITARGTVGKIVFAGCDMAMSQTSYALVGKDDYSQYYVYEIIHEIAKRLKHKANGAVFSAIVTRDFDSELIVIPPSEIVQKYCSVVEPLYLQILSLSKQSRAIVAIRNALLPRLMSGEIEVAA